MPLILWSGGADSTQMLHEALTNHKTCEDQDKKKRLTVRTISIVHPNLGANQEQANARHNIRQELQNRGYNWDHTEITITHRTPPLTQPHNHRYKDKPDDADFHAQACGENGGIIQPLVWIPIAIVYLKTDEDLQLGYIATDDANYYLHDLTKAFNKLQKTAGRTGKLQTPLNSTHKAHIIYNLKTLNLHHLTWCCENPDYSDPNNTPKDLDDIDTPTDPTTDNGDGTYTTQLTAHQMTQQPEQDTIEIPATDPPTTEDRPIAKPTRRKRLGKEHYDKLREEHQRRIQLGQGRPCNQCPPCMNQATALWQIQTGNHPSLRYLPHIDQATTLGEPEDLKKAVHQLTDEELDQAACVGS